MLADVYPQIYIGKLNMHKFMLLGRLKEQNSGGFSNNIIANDHIPIVIMNI